MEIRYKPSFVRQYKKLPHALQLEVKEKIQMFREDQHLPMLKVHKLHGPLQGYYSFSVNYAYRIIFLYEENCAVMHCVGDHTIYK